MKFENVLELKSQFGRTAAELGIKDSFMFSYQAKGNFCGHDCDCCLSFDMNDHILTDYDLYFSGEKAGELMDVLNDLCSGPVSSGMTPYAAVNGGAVYRYVFEDREAVFTLSMSQNNSLRISVKPNKNPGFCGTLTLQPAGFKGFFPEKAEADPMGYDGGILTVRVVNHVEAPLDLSDDFALFERRGNSYYSKFKIIMQYIPANTYTVRPGEAAEIRLDLRSFGKPVPNEYMVKFSGIELYFVLADASPAGKE